MALTVTDLGHGRLPLAGVSIAASASTAVTRVTHCTFYNRHTSAVTVTVYYLRSGEAITANGARKAKKTIPPDKPWVCLEIVEQVIEGSGSIYAVPSVDNVIDYNISGEVIT